MKLVGLSRNIRGRLQHSGTQADTFLSPEYLNKRTIIEAQHNYEQFKSIHARLAKLESAQRLPQTSRLEELVKNAMKGKP